MRYDEDHKSRIRERLLMEAAATIRAEGPDRLGVAAVMRRAGLTHGGFYVHFASKDDLIAEAVGYMFDRRYEVYVRTTESMNAEGALESLVDHYLTMAHLDGVEDGCPIPILAGEHHRLPDTARKRFELAVKRLTATIISLLKRNGVPDARFRATSAIAEMIGAVVLARIGDRDEARILLKSARRSVRSKLQLP